MRVSDGMRLDSMTQQMAQLSQRELTASRQASTGMRLGAPSDDPVAAAQAARVQASLDATDGYRASIRDVRGDVDLAETSLASAGDILTRAGELAMQGANGSLNAGDRTALAQEVGQLKDQLVTIANTKGTNGYLFGGTASTTSPFDASGNFLGNADDRVAEVGANVSMTVSVNGASTFTAAGGTDVFAELSNLQSALATNNVAALPSSVNTLDGARRQVLAGRLDAGTKLARLDTADSAHQAGQTSLSTERTGLLQVDPAAAYTQLQATQSAVEQSIAVARSTLTTLSLNRFG
jgi:flagellar hook-associated protein 3 FlgL